jgi:hypothetical protein
VPQLTDLEQSLQLVETTLRQVETQYNMYFAGQLRRPPLETRRRLEQLLGRLDRGYITSSAERFRLGSLQARFAKFSELWDRAIRAREEGRAGPLSRSARLAAPAAASATPPSKPATGDRTFGSATLTGEEAEPDKVRALYDSLMEARKATGAAEPFPFSKFVDIVKGQVARFQQSGSVPVAFRVSTKGGRVVFTARGGKTAEGDQAD